MRRSLLLFVLLLCCMPVRGVWVKEYRLAAGSSDAAIYAPTTGDARLCGFYVTETTGSAAASVKLYHGTDASGLMIGTPITLQANESAREGPACAEGPSVTSGIFVDRTGSSQIFITVRKF